jgi:hypothetical protein
MCIRAWYRGPGLDGACLTRTGSSGAGQAGVQDSAIGAVGALALTEAVPFSQLAALAYIWLLPMACPLLASRVKQVLPFLAVFHSKLPSTAQ